MSQEVTVQASLSFTKGSVSQKNLSITGLRADVAGTNFVQQTQTIPTTAGGTAIKLGSLASVGWFFIKNNDPTNFVEILNAVSGAVLLKLLPGEFACGRFHTTVTAPAALADTAACQIEYLIVEI